MLGKPYLVLMNPLFFPTSADLRKWLEANHKTCNEQWIGYYKKHTGKASITWPESVDQALCFGWIDGLRKKIDEESYMIRFTPRRKGSHWSTVNLKRIAILIAEKQVTPNGLEVYQRDKANRSNASYEQETVALSKSYEATLKANSSAWTFFESMPPSLKKPSVWWVMSAKREETRQKRLQVLIDCSAAGEKIPLFKWSKK